MLGHSFRERNWQSVRDGGRPLVVVVDDDDDDGEEVGGRMIGGWEDGGIKLFG